MHGFMLPPFGSWRVRFSEGSETALDCAPSRTPFSVRGVAAHRLMNVSGVTRRPILGLPGQGEYAESEASQPAGPTARGCPNLPCRVSWFGQHPPPGLVDQVRRCTPSGGRAPLSRRDAAAAALVLALDILVPRAAATPLRRRPV